MTENANDRIAKGLVGGMMDGYLPESRKVETVPLSEMARARAPRARVQATPRSNWEERLPELRTPHVLSQDRVAAKLVVVRARVREERGLAVVSADDFEVMVSEVSGMLLDTAEGAGMVVKGRFVGAKVRRFVADLLREDMMFWGDDDRYLAVEIEE